MLAIPVPACGLAPSLKFRVYIVSLNQNFPQVSKSGKTTSSHQTPQDAPPNRLYLPLLWLSPCPFPSYHESYSLSTTRYPLDISILPGCLNCNQSNHSLHYNLSPSLPKSHSFSLPQPPDQSASTAFPTPQSFPPLAAVTHSPMVIVTSNV